jgi:hypothetical protein
MQNKSFCLNFLYIISSLLAVGIIAERIASNQEPLVISSKHGIARVHTCAAGGAGCENRATHEQAIHIGKIAEFEPTNEWKEILPNQGIPVVSMP